MTIAENLINIEEALAEAFVAVGEKGGTIPAQKNVMNLITAIGEIGVGSTVAPRAVQFSTTVAGYISDNLEYHLAQAYTVIGNKGGTVPENKNFANLPAAIRSIHLADYGTMWYMEDGVKTSYQLLQQEELDNLSLTTPTGGHMVTFHTGLTIPQDDIVGYDLGEDVTILPAGFCCYLPNFNHPFTYKGGITPQGPVLSYLPNFNSTVTLESGVEYAPLYFLYECPKFNQPIALPSTLKRFNYALSGATAFAQPLSLPASLESFPALERMDNFVGPLTILPNSFSEGVISDTLCVRTPDCNAFQQGLTLAGAGAAWLKETLYNNFNAYTPDGTPPFLYRNVIGINRWLPSAP